MQQLRRRSSQTSFLDAIAGNSRTRMQAESMPLWGFKRRKKYGILGLTRQGMDRPSEGRQIQAHDLASTRYACVSDRRERAFIHG
jgi:hypothetical protein